MADEDDAEKMGRCISTSPYHAKLLADSLPARLCRLARPRTIRVRFRYDYR